jgi:sigma-54 dependent transcriptional regulator, acetoin dehydrogenase operon transcriptional activator AcoR
MAVTSPSGSPTGHARRQQLARERERPVANALALPPEHAELIDHSHERCAALGLSRIERPDFSPLGRADLNVARERNLRLQTHAAPVMEMLFDQIVNSGNMVVLCDATGVIIHSIGDDDFLQRAAKVALAPGVNWSEASKGTNGIGTALIEEAPTLVHADEHYLHANQFLTCSAAPIIDPRGNVLGVLDVSGDRHSYHQHTMALVKMSARMIENQWLQDHHRQSLRIHFHCRIGHIGSLMEGILAVSPEGRILGANRSALELLQISNSALRQRTLMAVFGVRVEQLADHFRSPLATPVALYTEDGRVFHAMARIDWPVWSRVSEAANAETQRHSAEAGEPTALAPGTAPPETAEPSPALSTTSPIPCATPTAPCCAGFQGLRTGEPQIETLVSRLRCVLDQPVPLMLHGESGTGKHTWARAIHAESTRREQALWWVHAGALTGGTLETEWAHQRARAAQPVATAGTPNAAAAGQAPGTVVLAHLEDMPDAAQADLLRWLQGFDHGGAPAGWTAPAPALIGLSTVPPRELMNSGRLRPDLYHRLNGLSVRLPALRARDDLALLTRTLLADRLQLPRISLSPEALAVLHRHSWPGNLRELQNVLRVAAALAAATAVIRPEHLPDDLLDTPLPALAVAHDGLPQAANVAHLSPNSATPPPDRPASPEARDTESRRLHEVERLAIEQAVAAAGGNLSLAAKQLGVSRNTIYRKLRWNERSSS